MKLKIDCLAKIKNHKVRPPDWNSNGKMDHYYGKTVEITYISTESDIVKIKTYSGERSWTFQRSDFELHDPLPNELFEI